MAKNTETLTVTTPSGSATSIITDSQGNSANIRRGDSVEIHNAQRELLCVLPVNHPNAQRFREELDNSLKPTGALASIATTFRLHVQQQVDAFTMETAPGAIPRACKPPLPQR